MSVLDRKLARDLRSMGGQLLAIVAVMACGVAAFVALMTNHATLSQSQASYYDRFAFADVFASVTRAPAPVAARIAEIPGVARVDTRVRARVRLSVGGLDEPVSGTVVSVAPGDALNRVYLRHGRMPGSRVGAGELTEVAVSEAFARVHQLELGDRLDAVLDGRRQQLRVVGFAMSPEYVFNITPDAPAPDDRRNVVLWMHRSAAARAFDFEGAFNDVALALVPGADIREVIDRLDLLLSPYGAHGAHGRERQASHRALTQELDQLASFGMVVPTIFLGVAAFLINVVLSRLIQTQREQIAVIKAVGYGTAAIVGHFARLVGSVVLCGLALGVGLGTWLGSATAQLYRRFFAFPTLDFALDGGMIAVAALVCGVAAAMGAWRAVAQIVALPPAEAMRPAAPAAHRQGILERTGVAWLLGPVGRMGARSLLRRPIRAAMTVAGLSLSVAILVVGSFSGDAIDYLLRVGFGLAQREEVSVSFTTPVAPAAQRELARLPGVAYAEGTRVVPVRMVVGAQSSETTVVGLEAGADLRRLINVDLRETKLPSSGMIMSSYLAERFGVGVGDRVGMQRLDHDRGWMEVEIAGLVDEMFGLSAYMELGALQQQLAEGPRISGALIEVEGARIDEVYRALDELPGVATVTRKDAALRGFLETSAEIQRVSRVIMVLFASTIAVGVVYNSARIAFQERSRELASLRVMGFSRAEVTWVLLGELGFLLLLALPVGWLVGRGLVVATVSTIDAELYRFPPMVEPSTYAFASIVVLSAGTAAALVVRRGVDRLDMIGVLKTRD